MGASSSYSPRSPPRINLTFRHTKLILFTASQPASSYRMPAAARPSCSPVRPPERSSSIVVRAFRSPPLCHCICRSVSVPVGRSRLSTVYLLVKTTLSCGWNGTLAMSSMGDGRKLLRSGKRSFCSLCVCGPRFLHFSTDTKRSALRTQPHEDDDEQETM